MKTFWNIIGIWFLIQLILISAADASNSLGAAKGTWSCGSNNDISQTVAFIMGAFLPLTGTPLVNGEWCWKN